MSVTMTEQKEEKGERVKVVVFLLISLVFIVAEVAFMGLSIIKAPDLIQMVYDKVTLPSALLFITHLKGIFQLVMVFLCCIPAIALMGGTGLVMSKIASPKE